MYQSIDTKLRCGLPTFIALCLALVLISGCGRQHRDADVSMVESPIRTGGPADDEETTGQSYFSEVAIESNVRFAYRNGREGLQYRLIEMLGGGVGLLDYDHDGLADLCFVGGGVINQENGVSGRQMGFFQNRGGFQWRDVGQGAGVQGGVDPLEYTHGVAVADYNNDGFSDFYMTSYTGGMLYTNQGDGSFLVRNLGDQRLSTSAAWGDLDADGNLDLYIAHYAKAPNGVEPICNAVNGQREICPPRDYEPLPDAIFYSNGNGEFRLDAEQFHVAKPGRGLGVLIADIDHNGSADIYVANDTSDNFLFLSDGAGNFREVGILNGVGLSERGMPDGSMGVDVFDFNNDLKADIWVSNYENESFALYRGEVGGQFLHVSQSTGVTALGGLFVGFGTSCGDFDLDGDEDVLITNGHVLLHPLLAPLRQLPLFLENQSGTIRRMKPTHRFLAEAREGRGLAAGDLDNDGDLDACISHLNENVALLRNNAVDRSWLGVELIGKFSNRDAIGARITLKTTRGDQLRLIKGGSSYLSSPDRRVLYGIPSGAEPTELQIEWPSGIRQSVAVTRHNCYLSILETEPPGT